MVISCFSVQRVVGKFKTGADRLCAAPGKYLKGIKIGILCHKASIVARDNHHEHLVEVLHRLADRKEQSFEIVALFAPEHGFDGSKEAFADVAHSKHPKIGCPIYSLHFGKIRKPQPAMFKGVDLVLVDLQGVGVRCYTYISTMVNMLEAAAAAKVSILVLDRPNPIKGWGPSGAEFDPAYSSFLAKINIPFVHDMTMGEIAKMAAKNIGCTLSVISTKGSQAEALRYLRHHYVPPSPNLSSLRSQFCYPMVVPFEGTNYSEGRGTDMPFEQFGAPWVDGAMLADRLNEQKIPGVIFEATSFTPESSERALKPKHQGKLCGGVVLKITDRSVIKPLDVARSIMATLFALYPLQSRWLTTKRVNFIIDQLIAGPTWRLSVEAKNKKSVVPNKKAV